MLLNRIVEGSRRFSEKRIMNKVGSLCKTISIISLSDKIEEKQIFWRNFREQSHHMCEKTLPPYKHTWSPALPTKPVDNIRLHKYTYAKQFRPSYERDWQRTNISRLLSCDYHRIWIKEHVEYLERRNSKYNPKWIEPNKRNSAKNRK